MGTSYTKILYDPSNKKDKFPIFGNNKKFLIVGLSQIETITNNEDFNDILKLSKNNFIIGYEKSLFRNKECQIYVDITKGQLKNLLSLYGQVYKMDKYLIFSHSFNDNPGHRVIIYSQQNNKVFDYRYQTIISLKSGYYTVIIL